MMPTSTCGQAGRPPSPDSAARKAPAVAGCGDARLPLVKFRLRGVGLTDAQCQGVYRLLAAVASVIIPRRVLCSAVRRELMKIDESAQGQLAGLIAMIESGRDCADVVTQLAVPDRHG
jgi:hypothetical protein